MYNPPPVYLVSPKGTFVDNQALKTARLQKKLAHRGFVLLRKLAAHTGRLPDSYLVKKDADFRVEKTILAAGGFADVRRGTLAETKVAVKTIRVAETSDFPNVQKVGTVVNARSSLRQDA